MTPQELSNALQELDRLYLVRSSFSSWLKGSDTAQKTYDEKRAAIEKAFPGLRIVYVDVTFKMTHALIADESE